VTGALTYARRSRGADVVVLASPHNRNALSIRLLHELLEHVQASASGDGQALVLDHEGPVFCAGVDLRERQALNAAEPTHSTLLARLLRALWDHPKPLLCRVDGAARGGGMGLVACADVVVASPRATFAYSEVKVGVAPALVLAVTLPKVAVGPLLPALLTGEPFDVEAAQRLGLVARVDGGASLEPELAAIGANGPNALQTVKRLARDVSVEDALAAAERLSAELFAGAEAREGMAAFTERRPPAWVVADPPVSHAE
jgi:enoyl-CoA hydratase/carnithine racemase